MQMCFLVFLVRSPDTINLMHYTASIIIRRPTGLHATKTRTEDYNRAKFALKYSFVGILLQVILSGGGAQAGFGHCCNKNKNIYNIRPVA